MRKLIDLTGREFGLLTVVERGENSKGGRATWECECECGKIKNILTENLSSGRTKSCGCLNREVARENSVTHGLWSHPLYSVWSGMMSRCYNDKASRFRDYGGRGITVCISWKDPSQFITWALANGYTASLQLDRLDNDGCYAPENCHFTTPRLNSINRRKRSDNKSGYVGVLVRGDRFRANIRDSLITRKLINLGTFDTAEEAVEARNKFITDNNLPHKIQKVLDL